jgi:hypothetical protein
VDPSEEQPRQKNGKEMISDVEALDIPGVPVPDPIHQLATRITNRAAARPPARNANPYTNQAIL